MFKKPLWVIPPPLRTGRVNIKCQGKGTEKLKYRSLGYWKAVNISIRFALPMSYKLAKRFGFVLKLRKRPINLPRNGPIILICIISYSFSEIFTWIIFT